MFITLLGVTFVIALATSFIVVRLFRSAIGTILDRVVSSELSGAWHRYLNFAVVVVGVSGGVRIWELEKYITARSADMEPIVLNSDRWVLEVYRTLIGTLQSAASGSSTVATRRRRSPEAAIELYLSMPIDARRDVADSVSKAQIHGPAPSFSCAVNNTVRSSSGVGYSTPSNPAVNRSACSPSGRTRHRSISPVAGRPREK